MNRYPLRYSIIRLRPHVETEEFANVGAVLVVPETGYLGSRIETRRLSRFTSFFDRVDRTVIKATLHNFDLELKRIVDLAGYERTGQQRLDLNPRERADHLFTALTKERGGIIHFSDVRFAIHENPELFLDQIFEYYVSRSFVDSSYHQAIMEKKFREALKLSNINRKFEERDYESGIYSARFPFVGIKDGRERIAVKPLFLGHENPNRIIEHANTWGFRVKRLRDQLPQHVTFAIQGPGEAGSRAMAFDEATALLRQSGAQVVGSTSEALDIATRSIQ